MKERSRTDPITAAKLAELRQIAENATPGPWSEEDWEHTVVSPQGGVATTPRRNLRSAYNAAHIAAFDPPTGLALLDQLVDLQARIAAWETAADEWNTDRFLADRQRDALQARIDAADALHQPHECGRAREHCRRVSFPSGVICMARGTCTTCGKQMPCPTALALHPELDGGAK